MERPRELRPKAKATLLPAPSQQQAHEQRQGFRAAIDGAGAAR
jgi:hypothetical protein